MKNFVFIESWDKYLKEETTCAINWESLIYVERIGKVIYLSFNVESKSKTLWFKSEVEAINALDMITE